VFRRASAPRRSPFERRKRAAARAALYLSLGWVVLLLAGVRAYLPSLAPRFDDLAWEDIDFGALPEVRLLQRYLQIDTSQPAGDELAGARFLAGVLAEAGIPATLERMGERKANLWAILEGEEPGAIVLHHHIDTDPVTDGEAWTYGPFSGHIDPPYLYGRGAFDMKSLAVAQLAAFLDLAKSGRRPRRSVILLATGSEEVGSDLGTKWILAHRPELARRFRLFLTEGGSVESLTIHDVKYWGIEFVQKRVVEVSVCGPERTRLEALREELTEQYHRGDFHLRTTPETRAFLARYAATRGRAQVRRALLAPERLALDAPAFFELPVYVRDFLRDDAVPYPVEEQPGGGFRLKVNVQLLPGSDFGAARERLLPAWRTAGLAMTVYDEGGAPHGSPLDGDYRLLERALSEGHRGTPVGPLFLLWSITDARFARAAGIPAYGFSPFLIFTTDSYRVAKPDERIQLPAFVAGVEVYRRTLRRLAG
jgi:acetylornithine deacetylase/succinyl-diaminopimelate desuccinylase-like protein